MKKLKFTLISYVFLARVLASSEVYVDVKSGFCNIPETNGVRFCSSHCLSAEVGRFIYDNVRFSANFGYVFFDAKNRLGRRDHFLDEPVKARTYVTSLFLNVYRDFELGDLWCLYIGCGVGVTRLRVFAKSLGGDVTSDAKNLLAGQVMLGVTRKISERWAISSGYRCMKLANASNIKDNGLGINESQYRTPPPSLLRDRSSIHLLINTIF